MTKQRVEILGVPVDCVDMVQAVSYVDDKISDGESCTVIAVNPEKVIKANEDASVLDILRSADLLIPDGIGVVFAARLLFGASIGRVAGADLMPELCALAERKGYKVFLYGASAEVNDAAAAELLRRYPDLDIAGTQHGYYDGDMDDLVDRIKAAAADMVFLALGSPRQELWMREYRDKLSPVVCQGVGGTFDVLAGNVKRAPALFRAVNLEWLYRLLSQPSRLIRQRALPVFSYRVLKRKLLGLD